MGHFAAHLLILALCAFGLSAAARAERRVALLIGNAAYREAALRNPVNDVAAMKAALTAAGFDTVIARTDVDQTGMLRALRSFEDAAAGADIGVVFYSGHGIEFRGQNYLLPVDAHLDTDRDVEDRAINLDRVLESLSGATKLKLVLLDACRSNPFVDGMRRVATKGVASKGLAPVEASTVDTLIAYAAAPGRVALDGDGAQSPFTAALVRHLTTPGLDVELALRRVRDDVVAATDHAQVPFKTGSLGEDEIALARPVRRLDARPPAASPPPATPEGIARPRPDQPETASLPGNAAGTQPKLIAAYGVWGVYEGRSGTSRTCFTASRPLIQPEDENSRQSTYMIASRSQGTSDFSVLPGFLTADITGSSVSVGKSSYAMSTLQHIARLSDSDSQDAIIQGMLGAQQIATTIVKKEQLSYRSVQSTFSLSGFPEAWKRISADCP